ncbi:hypothetical protein EI546_06640 [Aequorivita sp. H23M31]|uniref:DUF4376 domain-containing protein n=1 Tax=Aequorivita ciconiae TaxID=2494375 RepID=A0A410G2A5_9FLAO|nr:hypothetical protein [Aequorivita sp. H23M31]QAA81427.1 hypothetical protein EI546_06640 [Aequorivita sp. H23M31]
MKYYIAYETDYRPFVLFNLVADSLEDLQELGLENSPLVVTEDQLTDPADPGYISYQYGICHQRVFNGNLEARPASEITKQQADLAKALEYQKTRRVGNVLDEGTFVFDGKEFPLTPAARAVYAAVIEATPPSTSLITTTGTYALADTKIDAFKAAYYAALFTVNNAEMVS